MGVNSIWWNYKPECHQQLYVLLEVKDCYFTKKNEFKNTIFRLIRNSKAFYLQSLIANWYQKQENTSICNQQNMNQM